MRDYRKEEVYHSLDQLVIEVYAVTRALDQEERQVIGVQMQKAATRALTAVVRGCSTRNFVSYIPYLEDAHGASEELGQCLRIAQRLKLLPQADIDFLLQRQRGCSQQLLRKLKRMLFRAEEAAGGGALAVDDGGDGDWDGVEAEGGVATLPAVRRASRPRLAGLK